MIDQQWHGGHFRHGLLGAPVHSYRVRQSGAAAVEFALVMIPLFLIVFGIIQFGLAYNRQQGMHAGTREAGRVASIGASIADADLAFDNSVNTINAADVTLTYTQIDVDGGTEDASADPPCDGTPQADRVRVEAAITSNLDTYRIEIPFGPSVGPDYQSTAVFVCEPRTP